MSGHAFQLATFCARHCKRACYSKNMDNKYCDCGDPFQIHESTDSRCSKVRGVVRNNPSPSPEENQEQVSDLLEFTRKVSSLAGSLSGVMTFFGILTIIGGAIISFQSSTIDLGNGYGATSHPYIQLGIIIALVGVLEILILRLVFNYIQMQARFREWQMSK